jgi:hypothetical protein
MSRDSSVSIETAYVLGDPGSIFERGNILLFSSPEWLRGSSSLSNVYRGAFPPKV